MTKIVTTSICVDCICLPMCISKGHIKLLNGCKIMNNFFNYITDPLDIGGKLTIVFNGIDKEMTVERETNLGLLIDEDGDIFYHGGYYN